MKKKYYFLLSLLIIGFALFFYYKGLPFEEINLASLHDEGLIEWMETNRQQGGVYTLEKEGELFVHYYSPDSYSYPEIKIRKTLTGKVIIEVKKKGAASEQFIVEESLTKVNNIKYKEIEIKELY